MLRPGDPRCGRGLGSGGSCSARRRAEVSPCEHLRHACARQLPRWRAQGSVEAEVLGVSAPRDGWGALCSREACARGLPREARQRADRGEDQEPRQEPGRPGGRVQGAHNLGRVQAGRRRCVASGGSAAVNGPSGGCALLPGDDLGGDPEAHELAGGHDGQRPTLALRKGLGGLLRIPPPPPPLLARISDVADVRGVEARQVP
mmetsp:Transcript_124858/g.361164  ORF Transcript_124858/g.361164 Transcript_124858/m.361164 type:complete len:203 (-) Transcript_124858:1866-2474(-)